jgi:hypothetical protein
MGRLASGRFDEGFDAIVGRLILMYSPDPIDAMRKLLGAPSIGWDRCFSGVRRERL